MSLAAFCQHHRFKLFHISTLVDTCLNTEYHFMGVLVFFISTMKFLWNRKYRLGCFQFVAVLVP